MKGTAHHHYAILAVSKTLTFQVIDMPTALPFSPRAHSTQKAAVAAGSNVKLTMPPNVCQVWVDNRGTSDLLVEFEDPALEANSFRVPPQGVVILSHPSSGQDISLYLSRPAGAATEDAIVTPGEGF